MSDEEPDDTSEDLAPTKLSSFMRAALAVQPLTGDTVKVSLPTEKPTDNPPWSDEQLVRWPDTLLGPFRYAVVGGIPLEYKDGKWLDENGDEVTLTVAPPNNVAAHRP